jgi:hypothetical protein
MSTEAIVVLLKFVWGLGTASLHAGRNIRKIRIPGRPISAIRSLAQILFGL